MFKLITHKNAISPAKQGWMPIQCPFKKKSMFGKLNKSISLGIKQPAGGCFPTGGNMTSVADPDEGAWKLTKNAANSLGGYYTFLLPRVLQRTRKYWELKLQIKLANVAVGVSSFGALFVNGQRSYEMWMDLDPNGLKCRSKSENLQDPEVIETPDASGYAIFSLFGKNENVFLVAGNGKNYIPVIGNPIGTQPFDQGVAFGAMGNGFVGDAFYKHVSFSVDCC